MMTSVLRRCWLGNRKVIRPSKNEWWDAGVIMCLGQGADLDMAKLMPLPLTISFSSKPYWFYLPGFPFWWVLAHPGSPGQNPRGPLKSCVFVCVCDFLTLSP